MIAAIVGMSFSFTSCLNCGSYFVKPHRLCLPCTELLDPFKFDRPFLVHDLTVKSLYQWPPGVSDTLSSLILSLKTAKPIAWNFYAHEFCAQWSSTLDQEPIQFVTMKSASGNRHAQNWTEALIRIIGGTHIDGLRLTIQASEQKDLSWESRSFRVLEKDVEFSLSNKRPVVFADDVLTTGFTALAAYKALGRPKNFQVWCMAWRPPSSIAAGHRA